MIRKILHLDLDAFFCAVEEQRNPALVGKPFAVGGRPENRGVVASCSYPARKFGVRSAMPMARAVRLCPQLIIVSSRHGAYSEISAQVMERLKELTPLVEQVSIDEAFLDLSDSDAQPLELARKLQERINQELGLPCSLGVAANKLLAKIANDVGKAAAHGEGPPNAITTVAPGMEAEFLAPLPVEALWGVGPKTASRLEGLGVLTIGDLAGIPEARLARIFGKNGHDLSLRSRGIDHRPIETSHETKSISKETTFSSDIRNQEELLRNLLKLSEGVGRRLRRSNLCGTTVKLKIRWPDFTTLTRQTTQEKPIDQDADIFKVAVSLFQDVWRSGQPVRLLGVGVSGLGPPVRQLSLWDQEFVKDRRLQSAVDQLRRKYGVEILQRASQLDRKRP
jgi:DNA polymerase-4